jgi:hypothetical protein
MAVDSVSIEELSTIPVIGNRDDSPIGADLLDYIESQNVACA